MLFDLAPESSPAKDWSPNGRFFRPASSVEYEPLLETWPSLLRTPLSRPSVKCWEGLVNLIENPQAQLLLPLFSWARWVSDRRTVERRDALSLYCCVNKGIGWGRKRRHHQKCEPWLGMVVQAFRLCLGSQGQVDHCVLQTSHGCSHASHRL